MLMDRQSTSHGGYWTCSIMLRQLCRIYKKKIIWNIAYHYLSPSLRKTPNWPHHSADPPCQDQLWWPITYLVYQGPSHLWNPYREAIWRIREMLSILCSSRWFLLPLLFFHLLIYPSQLYLLACILLISYLLSLFATTNDREIGSWDGNVSWEHGITMLSIFTFLFNYLNLYIGFVDFFFLELWW